MTTIDVASFGRLPDGRGVSRINMVNRNGTCVVLSTLGGCITECHVPDRDGNFANVVLGFDSPIDYLHDVHAVGATIGRFANRINKAHFDLEGQPIDLDANDAHGHHLHGGSHGFQHRLWQVSVDSYPGTTTNAVNLFIDSEDGDQGYPGNLELRVRYMLDDRDDLHIEYVARTDKTTIINPTNHSYFNLGGSGDSVLDHELRVMASNYTPTDASGIPDGSLCAVDDTALDFRRGRALGAMINDPLLAPRDGYDHNLVLDKAEGVFGLAAILSHPESGRRMSVMTTEPGLQLYTANHLASEHGNHAGGYRRHSGVCLETQHFPDSPNHPAFPSTTLQPGALFHSKTVYRFDTYAGSAAR